MVVNNPPAADNIGARLRTGDVEATSGQDSLATAGCGTDPAKNRQGERQSHSKFLIRFHGRINEKATNRSDRLLARLG